MKLNENFYEYINKDWLKNAKIKDDKARIGSFSELSDNIEEIMFTQLDKWIANDENVDNHINNFIKLYKLSSDFKKRDELGIEPIKEILNRYRNYETIEDYLNDISKLEIDGLYNAIPLYIAPDFKNADVNVLWADSLSTILPDTTYYGTKQGQELINKWEEIEKKILIKFNFNENEINKLIKDYKQFDRIIAEYNLSNEQKSEYAKLYNEYTWENFKKLSNIIPWDKYTKDVMYKKPNKIIISELKFWEHINEIISKENWNIIKSYLIINIINSYTNILSDELRILGSQYGRILGGIPEPYTQKKAAYYLSSGPYNQALGMWYGHKYLSIESKKDVEDKIKTMIQEYKNRLIKNEWLDSKTINKAIIKLENINFHIGYPEKLPEIYNEKIIDENKSLVDNILFLIKLNVKNSWDKLDRKVDKNEWHMAANVVNAYYDPQQNTIVFPAAILQYPFYSLKQHTSENYGGIGAVIAHEISHAFDTNGADFDENGSLNNWWTNKDYKEFKQRTEKMVQQFDNLISYGTKVNGKLTVSENVADLGGLTAALYASKKNKNHSNKLFFMNWGKIWRMKARPEFRELLAKTDTHAPADLRVNVQVKNFDDFFTTFNITEKDEMWLDKKSRIEIW